MKKALLIVLAVISMIFVISCTEDEIDGFAAGDYCETEGEQVCSADRSAILVCSQSSWDIKKQCNSNFAQYCKQAADGSYSCKDEGNTEGGDNTPADTGDSLPADTGDSLPADTGDTTPADTGDTTPADTGDTTPADTGDTPPADTGDTTPADTGDTTPADTGDTTPADTGDSGDSAPSIPAPGDCANIMNCMNACAQGDQTCVQNCYNNGTSAGQSQYQAWDTCNTNNSCGYYYDCLWTKCRNEQAVCGMGGDTVNYKIPYGKAIINGTFNYLNPENSESVQGFQGTFVTGTFGNSGNIVDPAGKTFSLAQLGTFQNSANKYIMLYQDYIDEANNQIGGTGNSPVARMLISATAPGTYTVGLGDMQEDGGDKVRIFISDENCTHAIGYGKVTISAISQTTGETTITISGEVDLYSYKAMPYYGGDISDSTNWIACSPK